ncbi:MAG: hypothetical protein U0793_29260 [Gemmataceae bacterium]
MKVRTVLASLVCGALLCVGLSSAQTGDDPAKVREDLKLQERKLLQQFKDFEESLHKLKRRMAASRDPDDRAKAELLEKVIEKARDESIVIQFEQINAALKDGNFKNITEIRAIQEKTAKLSQDLQDLLALMQMDPSYDAARKRAADTKKLIEMLEAAIKEQRDVQARIDLGKSEAAELKAAQEKVSSLTDKIAKAMADKGKSGDGTGGEAKNMKGESKAGESKGSGKSGEAKDGGKEGSKAGETKEGKGGEAKAGGAKGSEAKSGEGAKSDPKAGAKAGSGSESKAGSKGSKGSEGASGSKSGAGKEGEKKAGSAKDDGDKSSKKEKETPGEAKGGEKSGAGSKSGDKEAKSGESKSGKGSESKSGESKGSKGSESKSGSKSGSKGSESKGESKSGSSSSGQSSSKSGESSPSSSKGSKGGDDGAKKDEIGKKQVEDAQGYQKSATEKIAKKDNPGASDDAGDAAKELEKAKKKLEELLKQIREEELERLLAALQARCEKMLAMQIRVQAETIDIFKLAQLNADKQPDRDGKLRSIKQADEEKNIVAEATKAIQMLEAEGSAVAFPVIFDQVREDMKIVQRRLELADVNPVTQAIEQDIIDTLKEMIEALKKQRQENKDSKSGKSGKSGPQPPQDQKLLDQIAELKMIRSMQLRVNARTTTYGRLYDGEQARDMNIRRELRNLAERQERITDITGRIAKGDNK